MNVSFRDGHPRMQLAGFRPQLVTGMNFPQGKVRASPVPSPPHLQLPQLPAPSDGSIFTHCHLGWMLGSKAGAFAQRSPPLSARREEGSSPLWTRFPVLFSHSSVWAAQGDIYHKMESGVCRLTVKSVRYWIYMVSAEHIRRSSSSCLFKTAIIIQAVILPHWCFWKTI